MLGLDQNGAAGREDQRAVGERDGGPAGAPRRRGSLIPSWSSGQAPEVHGEVQAGDLREADACTRPGEIGELLRREGLYTSHLTYWRKQREAGALKELGQPRGRKPVDREAEIATCAGAPSAPRPSSRRRVG